MSVQLKKIHQDNDVHGMKTISLQWSNDRHHMVAISESGTVEDVINALMRLARMVSNDPHLKD